MSESLPPTPLFSRWKPQVLSPSLGGGTLSSDVRERIRELAEVQRVDVSTPLELRLFSTSVALKIALSEVSMHLPKEWRLLLFKKIDDLHVPEDWDDTERPADLASFRTFLRTTLELGPMRDTSLGLSVDGNILAGWKRGRDTLSLTFLPKDRIRWAVVQYVDGEMDSAAGTTTLNRLREVLHPYHLEVWFADADKIPAK